MDEYFLVLENLEPWVKYNFEVLSSIPDVPKREIEIWNWIEMSLVQSNNIHFPNYLVNCLVLDNLIEGYSNWEESKIDL